MSVATRRARINPSVLDFSSFAMSNDALLHCIILINYPASVLAHTPAIVSLHSFMLFPMNKWMERKLRTKLYWVQLLLLNKRAFAIMFLN
ncbi:hypothetical protein CEXT_567381 [Caerostris extrusa]|uniref:Uncharacterized protein n=1 Tax=Caerostris extrusa TaxID=172846 RepID=A0AAV4V5P2_CAEEX|nr:hypothetical protein CEXT_567381 [Caerostris extrusa]